MADQQKFNVTFWGVRGSIACPGAETVRYGGTTSCLEVLCGNRRLIFDGGTGLRKLGDQLVAQGPVDTDIFSRIAISTTSVACRFSFPS